MKTMFWSFGAMALLLGCSGTHEELLQEARGRWDAAAHKYLYACDVAQTDCGECIRFPSEQALQGHLAAREPFALQVVTEDQGFGVKTDFYFVEADGTGASYRRMTCDTSFPGKTCGWTRTELGGIRFEPEVVQQRQYVALLATYSYDGLERTLHALLPASEATCQPTDSQ
ncbi:MAG: hypothetical protein QM765_35660 [Myxococcales bacterium]